MRAWVCSMGLLLLLFALPSVAHAAPPTDSSAQAASEAYERGMARFRLDEYEPAIKEWEDGFRTKPAPQFLYNIAQAYRAWKKPDKALVFYRKYLAMEPKSANRVAVEKTIAALEKQLRDAPPEPEPAPKPEPTIAPPVAPTPEPTIVATAPPPPAKKPVTKRAWFWGVVGTGIVVVAGAVVVGAVLGTRSSSTHLPAVQF